MCPGVCPGVSQACTPGRNSSPSRIKRIRSRSGKRCLRTPAMLRSRRSPADCSARSPAPPAKYTAWHWGNSACRRRPWCPNNDRNAHASAPARRSTTGRLLPRPGYPATGRCQVRRASRTPARCRTARACRRSPAAGSSAPPGPRRSAGPRRVSAASSAASSGPRKIFAARAAPAAHRKRSSLPSSPMSKPMEHPLLSVRRVGAQARWPAT